MKIGIISDLHVDGKDLPENMTLEDIVLERVQHVGVDTLIVAGDISNDMHRSLAALNMLRDQAEIPVLFVPGNHDYWSKTNGITNTWDIYKAYQSFAGCLCERPYSINEEWVVIGNSGWYDYSMGEPSYSLEQFEKMHAMDRTWQDRLYVHWDRSNIEMHQFFYDCLEHDLQQHQGKNIILVTHMLSHPFFKVPVPNPQWEYFNAFLGSTAYMELCRKYQVRYSIMGHVHYRKQHEEEGTTYICACLGNHNEWRTSDAKAEVDLAMQVIEV